MPHWHPQCAQVSAVVLALANFLSVWHMHALWAAIEAYTFLPIGLTNRILYLLTPCWCAIYSACNIVIIYRKSVWSALTTTMCACIGSRVCLRKTIFVTTIAGPMGSNCRRCFAPNWINNTHSSFSFLPKYPRFN